MTRQCGGLFRRSTAALMVREGDRRPWLVHWTPVFHIPCCEALLVHPNHSMGTGDPISDPMDPGPQATRHVRLTAFHQPQRRRVAGSLQVSFGAKNSQSHCERSVNIWTMPVEHRFAYSFTGIVHSPPSDARSKKWCGQCFGNGLTQHHPRI